jgi:hypothetical protein
MNRQAQLIALPKIFFDLLRSISGPEDDVPDSCEAQLPKNDFEEGHASDQCHRFWPIADYRAEPSPQPPAKHERPNVVRRNPFPRIIHQRQP